MRGEQRERRKRDRPESFSTKSSKKKKKTTHLKPPEPRPNLFSRVGWGVSHGAFDSRAPVFVIVVLKVESKVVVVVVVPSSLPSFLSHLLSSHLQTTSMVRSAHAR